MKKIFLLIGVFSLLLCSPAFTDLNYNPNTGDLALDSSLGILNATASANIVDFVTALSGAYKVEKPKIEILLNKEKMSPADVYMATKVSAISGKSLDDVVKKYKKYKGKGWGVIAKKLGIKPGSKEFHALKADDSGILAKAKEKHSQGKEDKDKKQDNNKNKGKNK